MQSPRPAETILDIYRRIHLLGRSSPRAAEATAAFLGCGERAGAWRWSKSRTSAISLTGIERCRSETDGRARRGTRTGRSLPGAGARAHAHPGRRGRSGYREDHGVAGGDPAGRSQVLQTAHGQPGRERGETAFCVTRRPGRRSLRRGRLRTAGSPGTRPRHRPSAR
jgi:hypothetical protein